MGIQIDLSTSQFGVPFTGAYFRIVGATVRRNGSPKFVVSMDVHGYVTAQPEEWTQPIDVRRYGVDLVDVEAQAGDTFLAKCYAWLMMQDSMSGAIAV